MNLFLSDNPASITRRMDGGQLLWTLAHPALDDTIEIDPARPCDLTPAGAAVYGAGQDISNGCMANDFIAAMVGRCGVGLGDAERIADAWDMHSIGRKPLQSVGPVDHG